MRFFLTLTICWIYAWVNGQTLREPDPRATKILESIEKDNSKAKNVFYEFSLTMYFPEEKASVQNGTFTQSGRKYHLDLEAYAFVCDGISQWVVDKNNQEVQIHDYTEPDLGDVSTPQGLLKIYQNSQFDYQLVYEGVKHNQKIQQIEFKPLQKDTEYAKARLTLIDKTNQIQAIELFNKDGSRYHLEIVKYLKDQKLSDKTFIIAPSDFQGYHFEDLRIE